MTNSIKIKRLTFGSLFSIIFIGIGGWLIPFGIISGVAGLFGFDFIKQDDTYIHGWKALGSGLIGGPIGSFFVSLFFTLITFPGLWLYSFFQPFYLRYITSDKEAEQGAAANP